MTIPKSKRFRFSAIVTAANFLVFLFGILYGADLTSLGTGLALVNTPLYAYIWGDSARPSKENNTV